MDTQSKQSITRKVAHWLDDQWGNLCLIAAVCAGLYLVQNCYFSSLAPAPIADSANIQNVANTSNANIVWSETYGWVTTKPIEDFQVGDRAIAQNPEVSKKERTSWTEPQWDRWVKLSLVMPKPDGSDLKITLLRPESWVLDQVRYHLVKKTQPNAVGKSENALQPASRQTYVSIKENVEDTPEVTDAGSSLETLPLVPLSPLREVYRELTLTSSYLEYKAQQNGQELIGLFIQLNLPELGLTGYAILTNVEPAPAIMPGKGRVVTATFHHSSGDVIDLTVGDRYSKSNTETIGTTSNHPFWSVDRQKYIQAGELKIGETLKSFKGSGDQKVVIGQMPRPGPTPVYNLEVHGEHVYYVGQNGILVHNTYDPKTTVNNRGETVYPDGAVLRNAAGDPVIIPKNHTMSLRDPDFSEPAIIRSGGLNRSHGFTDAERNGFLKGNDGGTLVTPHHRHQIPIRDGGVFDELPRFGHPEGNVHLGGRPRRHPNDGRSGRNPSIFKASDEMKKLHADEVKQFFKDKGARLVRDPKTGLWMDPLAS